MTYGTYVDLKNTEIKMECQGYLDHVGLIILKLNVKW